MSPSKRRLFNFIMFVLSCTLLLASFVTVQSTDETKISWGSWKENRPWPEDPECGELVTRIAVPGTLPLRALASYPGSGNTWIRYLIEGGSGLYTGSIYSDKSIDAAGHHGELREYSDGSTIVQKTHHRAIYQPPFHNLTIQWRKQHIQQFKGRGVVVVRNPFKAVLSYWNYYRTKSHTSTVDKNSLKSQKFRDFAFVGITRWYEIISDWLDFGTEVYFVFYEDVEDDPVAELTSLLSYLGVQTQQARIDCIRKHLAGSFHRTKHQELNPYGPDHQMLFRGVIDLANRRIFEKTGRQLPTHKYTFFDTP